MADIVSLTSSSPARASPWAIPPDPPGPAQPPLDVAPVREAAAPQGSGWTRPPAGVDLAEPENPPPPEEPYSHDWDMPRKVLYWLAKQARDERQKHLSASALHVLLPCTTHADTVALDNALRSLLDAGDIRKTTRGNLPDGTPLYLLGTVYPLPR